MKVKKFKSLLDEPKVGDYVYCKSKLLMHYSPRISEEIGNFLSNNIGILTKIELNSEYGFPYTVRYRDIPDIISNHFGYNSRCFDRDEILEFDKDLETLKLKINAIKYNL